MRIKLITSVMSFLSIVNFDGFSQHLRKAHSHFKAGRFVAAQEEFVRVLDKNPDHLKANLYMGYIALLCNDLAEAEKWLAKTQSISPKVPHLNYLLAETFYRKTDFARAAPFYRLDGREAMAKKMEAFRDAIPYEMDEGVDEIRLSFIIKDPLPFVRAVVNDTFTGNFLIDTGGGEIILDSEFAREAGASIYGWEEGHEFGGGKKASIQHGKIQAINLDNHSIKNIPINTLPLRHIELENIKIDGIIGTTFLYQFHSTIDYKHNELILKRKKRNSQTNTATQYDNSKVVPFFMADDHYMVAHGSINNGDSILFFIDTGLAGNAFTCPKSTLKRSGLKIDKKNSINSMGGGGAFRSYAFQIDKVSLGAFSRQNLHGVFGPFPPSIEKIYGFHIKGLLSHEFFRETTLTIDFENMNFVIAE